MKLYITVYLHQITILCEYLYSDVDECTAGTDNCDDTNGACNNTVGSFTCACNPGYSGDGVTCGGIYLTNHQVNIYESDRTTCSIFKKQTQTE